MLHFLPSFILGCLSVIFLTTNTILWCIPFYIIVIFKIISPYHPWKSLFTRGLEFIAEIWVVANFAILKLFIKINWNVREVGELKRKGSYLITCNHQSWTDIMVLLYLFNRKIPFFKFFIKQELIWLPFLGVTWWALEYPFMKRYSPKTLQKKPELKGKDFETTRKLCEKYKNKSITVLNFIEGTRFTKAKHVQQKSPYENLLKPKSGGVGFVIGVMGEQFDAILDVTIAYPRGKTLSFWGFLSGKIKHITAEIEAVQISPKYLSGNYHEDASFRNELQEWTRELWSHKDQKMNRIFQESNE